MVNMMMRGKRLREKVEILKEEGEDDVEDTQATVGHTRPRKRRIIAANVKIITV